MGGIASLAVGSILGGFARHFISTAVGRMPFGTLLANLLGCFLIGLLHSLAASRLSLGVHSRMLLMIGFCGAFTTFSTLMLETSVLMDKGKSLHAFSNLAATVLLGFALFKLGAVLGDSPARGLDEPPRLAAENQPQPTT